MILWKARGARDFLKDSQTDNAKKVLPEQYVVACAQGHSKLTVIFR